MLYFTLLPQRVKRLRSSSRNNVCRDVFLIAQTMSFNFIRIFLVIIKV